MVWVPIALSRDVPVGTTRAVILDGQELVVWRGDGRTAQVWEDRCPHRGMRLSFGFVRGDALNCLYHGWEYGAGAACRRIPAHPDLTVPPTIKAKTFASAETGGMIWVDLAGASAPPPVVLAGLPIVSLAVMADLPAVLRRLGDPLPHAEAQLVEASLDGVPLTIGWHVPAAGKIMLHVVSTDPGNVESKALVALHRLRADAERREAA